MKEVWAWALKITSSTLAAFAQNSRIVYMELNTFKKKSQKGCFLIPRNQVFGRCEWMVVAGRMWVGDLFCLCLLQLLVGSETWHMHSQAGCWVIVRSDDGVEQLVTSEGKTSVSLRKINTNPHNAGTTSICFLYLFGEHPSDAPNHNISVPASLSFPGPAAWVG